MSWIIIAIFAYFLLAVTSIIDKFLLTGPRLSSKTYAFYVAALGIVFLFLIPFGVGIPEKEIITMAFLSGTLWIFAILALFESLTRFDVSRIIPAIGGVLPLFTLGLSYLFAAIQGQELQVFSALKILSFILLISGTIIINIQKGKNINKDSLILAVLTAFLFALNFTTSKIVYLSEPFISGLFWLRVSGIPIAFLLLFFKEVRKQVFLRKKHSETSPQKQAKAKILPLFILSQIIGAGAVFLQHWVIYLVPLMHLAFFNAIEGTRYVFLLIFTWVISIKFPKILEEKISFFILIQKVLSILLIIAGLILFSLT